MIRGCLVPEWWSDLSASLVTLQPVGWVAVVVAGIGVVWKWGPSWWSGARKVHGNVGAIFRLADTLATLPADIAEIKHELQHNGGGSTKDALVRTEAAVESLREDLAGVREDVSHVRRQSSALKTTLRRVDGRVAKLERGDAAGNGGNSEQA